jgi:hypothetical protein
VTQLYFHRLQARKNRKAKLLCVFLSKNDLFKRFFRLFSLDGLVYISIWSKYLKLLSGGIGLWYVIIIVVNRFIYIDTHRWLIVLIKIHKSGNFPSNYVIVSFSLMSFFTRAPLLTLIIFVFNFWYSVYLFTFNCQHKIAPLASRNGKEGQVKKVLKDRRVEVFRCTVDSYGNQKKEISSPSLCDCGTMNEEVVYGRFWIGKSMHMNVT